MLTFLPFDRFLSGWMFSFVFSVFFRYVVEGFQNLVAGKQDIIWNGLRDGAFLSTFWYGDYLEDMHGFDKFALGDIIRYCVFRFALLSLMFDVVTLSFAILLLLFDWEDFVCYVGRRWFNVL